MKLRGAEDTWRARVGDYRILYQVQDDRLLILVISNRSPPGCLPRTDLTASNSR